MSDCVEVSCCSSKEKLVADLKILVADAEELLRATASVAGDKMVELRERIGEHLLVVKGRLADAEAALIDRTKAAAHATDEYVHENPWQAVGVAAGVGLFIGLLAGRR